MRRHTLGILVTLLLLLSSAVYTTVYPHLQNPFDRYEIHSQPEIVANAREAGVGVEGVYKVVRVVDGDTVVLNMHGQNVTVRLVGLNTPEVIAPHQSVQCFGPEASKIAHTLLDDTSVHFEPDPSQGVFDKYYRTLGYIFLQDGTNFNQYMIERGYGKEYTFKSTYKYQKDYKAAQAQAQSQKRGLWSVCTVSA